MKRWVISGTGTEVGKSWVGCALARRVVEQGRAVAALKPVESGGDADARALQHAAAFHVEPSPFLLADPVSPHLAARRAGVSIELKQCRAWVERNSAGATVCLVELAGGLLTPLSDTATNADLLKELAPDGWVAVAPDRLGVLHELASLMLCARHLDLPPPIVVLSDPAARDLSTGTNAAELSRLGICRVAAVFPRDPSLGPQTSSAARALANAMALQ
jgi:dethiobiotin synthetase